MSFLISLYFALIFDSNFDCSMFMAEFINILETSMSGNYTDLLNDIE